MDYGDTLDSATALAPAGPLDGSGPGTSAAGWPCRGKPTRRAVSSRTSAGRRVLPAHLLAGACPKQRPDRRPVRDGDERQEALFGTPEAFAFDHRHAGCASAPREDYKSVINEFVKEWNGVGVVTQMPDPDGSGRSYQSSFPR